MWMSCFLTECYVLFPREKLIHMEIKIFNICDVLYGRCAQR